MSNSISKSAKGSKNVRANKSSELVAISTPQNSPKRVLETRDQWENIFSHTVFLIASYFKGQQPKGPRKGYAFGKALECPHERAYAQSLLAGFVTNKAGKVFKSDSNLSDAALRSKIVKTILLDTCLAKGGVEGAQSMIERSQPKREKALALAVLEELQKQEPKGLPYYPEVTATTPKSGSSKGKGNKTKSTAKAKATTPKGGSSKPRKSTRKQTSK